MPSPQARPIHLSPLQHDLLQRLVKRTTSEQRLVKRGHIEVLLTDEQRPGAPATFTFEQFMQIMAAFVRKTRGGRSAGERLDATRVG